MKWIDVSAPFPQTDEEAKQYIPDGKEMHKIYDMRRELGDSIPLAMIYVLELDLRLMEEGTNGGK